MAAPHRPAGSLNLAWQGSLFDTGEIEFDARLAGCQRRPLTDGSCQRTWDHAVPKVATSGPRISIQFRHVYPR